MLAQYWILFGAGYKAVGNQGPWRSENNLSLPIAQGHNSMIIREKKITDKMQLDFVTR